jgi:hypothetical protein
VTVKGKDGKTLALVKPAGGDKPAAAPTGFPPLAPTWMKALRGHGARRTSPGGGRRAEARNPEFNGDDNHRVVDDAVVQFGVTTDRITDLTPVAALPGLKRLYAMGSSEGFYDNPQGVLSDLRPLRGLKLEFLSVAFNKVTDLTPPGGRLSRRASYEQMPDH